MLQRFILPRQLAEGAVVVGVVERVQPKSKALAPLWCDKPAGRLERQVLHGLSAAKYARKAHNSSIGLERSPMK